VVARLIFFLLGIPVFVHQQDVLPGLANRLIAPWAKSVTVTFSASAKVFPKTKTEVTGNPIRQSILRSDGRRGREFLHVAADRPIVVCIGGGTGALSLNTLVSAAAPELLHSADVVHITGGRGTTTIHDDRYHAFPFLDAELPDVLAAASIVVTRAGLGTLSELGGLGKPAIVLPMPDTHQEANAKIIAEHQAAVVLDQRTCTPHQFTTVITRLLEDHQQRTALGTALHAVFTPGASERIAEKILAYDPQRVR
jgi:UDP-N-acetylglucosamine--N-acetylmuramyl-(pentapeptide) pyrophosphoryl-undecaprenol N-acetylglucosamine transferase